MAVASCDPNALESAARCFKCIPPGLKPSVNVSLLNTISGANLTIQQLLDNSRTFDRFNGSALGAEVYLLALIAGLAGQTPGQLANAARCFDCGRDGDLDDITGYLYAVQAGGSTVPANVITAATSYQRLFGVEDRISLYLTCQWAVMTGALAACDVAALLTASRCYTNCLSRYLLRAVRTYLLCYININAMGGGGGPIATDWANRVVANGGPLPSAATQSCLTTFLNSLSSNGILTRMLAVNCIAPDSLIAALTPLIKTVGLDPWTNHNFVGGDLTVNGLTGNGTTKYMQVGATPAQILAALGNADFRSFGLSSYQSDNSNTNSTYDLGVLSGGVLDSLCTLATQNVGVTYWDSPYFGAVGRMAASGLLTPTNGLNIGSRNSIASSQLYNYNSTFGFRTWPDAPGGNVTGAPVGAQEFYAFALNNSGVAQQWSNKRFSFLAIHGGLTAAEAQNFALAVQAMRVCLGGGFV